MITIDELKMQLGEHEHEVRELGDALAITASEKRVAELENKMTMPGFLRRHRGQRPGICRDERA